MLPVVDFWLGMGVDGMRLDAVPYLFEREGTNCENLPETHALPAEPCGATWMSGIPAGCCWPRPTSGPKTPWPISAPATNATWRSIFPLMPRLFMAIHMEDRFPIIDILAADAGDSRGLPVVPVPAQPR